MPHPPHDIGRFPLLVLALTWLCASACGPFSESCTCYPGGLVTLPSFGDAKIAHASSGGPCTARQLDADRIEVFSNTGGTCAITVQLTNGSTYSVSVEFVQLDPDGCCAGTYSVVRDPMWSLIDSPA